ncbi:MAG TPA: hypothetical protein VNW95_00175 [Mucilaginibacter sp.]|nr:hypothetical protein [Mucilaginibacter sp.]
MFLVHLPISFWISDVVFLFKFILTSFLYCAVLKDKAIFYLTRVIIHLAMISIPFYLLQLVSGDLVYKLGRLINLPPHVHDDVYTNFIIFTYVKLHAIRNSGFAWEPGAFGFFLNMGLLMHLLTNNFVLDKKVKWVVVAIITTLSTTSFIALLVITFIFLRANGVKLATLLIFIVPVLFILIFQLPFLFEKIAYIYNRDSEDMNNIDFLSSWYYKRGQQMPLNRFSSMLYLIQLFGSNLIWGISNIYEDSVPILKTINISNGIFAFMAKYGLIGLAYLLSRCYVLFKKFTQSIEISLYCLVVILILGFGEQIFLIPLMMCFFFLYYYSEPETDEADEEYIEEPEIPFTNRRGINSRRGIGISKMKQQMN